MVTVIVNLMWFLKELNMVASLNFQYSFYLKKIALSKRILIYSCSKSARLSGKRLRVLVAGLDECSSIDKILYFEKKIWNYPLQNGSCKTICTNIPQTGK